MDKPTTLAAVLPVRFRQDDWPERAAELFEQGVELVLVIDGNFYNAGKILLDAGFTGKDTAVEELLVSLMHYRCLKCRACWAVKATRSGAAWRLWDPKPCPNCGGGEHV